jgi:hypothetical protein
MSITRSDVTDEVRRDREQLLEDIERLVDTISWGCSRASRGTTGRRP